MKQRHGRQKESRLKTDRKRNAQKIKENDGVKSVDGSYRTPFPPVPDRQHSSCVQQTHMEEYKNCKNKPAWMPDHPYADEFIGIKHSKITEWPPIQRVAEKHKHPVTGRGKYSRSAFSFLSKIIGWMFYQIQKSFFLPKVIDFFRGS